MSSEKLGRKRRKTDASSERVVVMMTPKEKAMLVKRAHTDYGKVSLSQYFRYKVGLDEEP